MEEKVLIKSSRYKFSTAFSVITILFVLAFIISTIKYDGIFARHSYLDGMTYSSYYDEMIRTYEKHQASGDCGWLYDDGEYCYDCESFMNHPTKLIYILDYVDWGLWIPIYFGGAVFVNLIVFLWFYKHEITVTDKRVFGRTAFGKRVDLPIDSISAVGTRWPKGVAVATSSGKVAFLMIKNRDEIHKYVSDLLIERQNKVATAPVATIKQEIPQSNAEELKKYKELLDMGVITQEEFDTKKKQLLGL